MNFNKKKLCQLLVEFLEIAVHSLLKVKHIYPEEIFVRKQKYGNIVYETLHPHLKEYILNYMKAVYHFAIENQLNKIAVCFFDQTYKVIQEKVIFDIQPIRNDILKDTFLINLEKTFRSFFMNLNLLEHNNNNKNDLKFALQIYTTESNVIPFIENSNYEHFPWMQVSPKYCKITEAEITPFEIEENDFINMQIYIEKIC